MKRRSLPAFEKWGGLDLDSQPLRLPIDEDGAISAAVATNVLLDQVTGEVVRSPGSSVLSATAVPAGPVRGVFEYVGPGERILFARTRSGYYRLNDARTSWTLMHAAALRDSLQVPSFAQLGNWLVVVDGEQSFYWSPEHTYFTPWRSGLTMPAPRSTMLGSARRPTWAAAAGSTLTKNASYDFFFTLYNSATGEESAPSKLMVVRLTSTSLNLTVQTGYGKLGAGGTADGKLGSGKGFLALPEGVTHVRVYRSVANTPGTWYRVSDGSGGSAAAAADTVGDELTATISGTDVEATALTGWTGPPAGVTKVTSHVQRLFVSGSPQYANRLWWTRPGELEFGATQFIDVGRSSDPIVATVSFPLETATLGILCRNSCWTLGGYDETTFVGGLRQIAAGPGCLAPHAVAMVNGVAYCWNSAGIWRFDGNVVEPIDKGIRTAFLEAIRGA